MAGKATVLASSSSATRSDSVWQDARRCERSSDFAYTGPTVWMTHRARRSPPVVATARPVGRPSGYVSARIRLHSSRIRFPPLRWMAPSTPPPPMSEEFAAFTMASASCSVISPRSRTTLGGVIRLGLTSSLWDRPVDLAERLLVTPHVLAHRVDDVEHHRGRDPNARHHSARHFHRPLRRLGG